jgi:hypothetical protein
MIGMGPAALLYNPQRSTSPPESERDAVFPQRVPRNAPCPCGSGKKHKDCCYGSSFDQVSVGRPGKRPKFPIGTVALYGPDDKTTTKIAAGVIVRHGAEPILRRWVATDVTISPKVRQEMLEFFRSKNVKSVIVTDSNMGCPHEEGPDFPVGEDCPFCPFWKGMQGSNRKD